MQEHEMKIIVSGAITFLSARRISWLIVGHFFNTYKMKVESPTHMTNLVTTLLYKHVRNVLMDFLHEFFSWDHVTYTQCAAVCLMMRWLNPGTHRHTHKHTQRTHTLTELLWRQWREDIAMSAAVRLVLKFYISSNAATCRIRMRAFQLSAFTFPGFVFSATLSLWCKDYQVVRPRDMNSHCLTAS